MFHYKFSYLKGAFKSHDSLVNEAALTCAWEGPADSQSLLSALGHMVCLYDAIRANVMGDIEIQKEELIGESKCSVTQSLATYIQRHKHTHTSS